jgi:predicted  nucleic acid-binding Zn-ribbon protein
MNLEQLNDRIENAIDTSNQAHDSLNDAEYNIDDLESYLSSTRDQVSDGKYTLSNLSHELDSIKEDLKNLEGFNIDKVRQEIAEELIFKLTNKFGKFIKEALASDLYPDELKKAPAKKSTETDNQ